MKSLIVQIRRKGVITLPAEWRRRYGLAEGDVFTLIDLGDGAFLLAPRASQVAHHGGRVARLMAEENVGLEDVLAVLDRERETYYREHYIET